jgi:hypothetical protein
VFEKMCGDADRSRARRQVGQVTKTVVLLHAALSKGLFHIQVM